MRQTFATTMPDRVGAFLGASRCIARIGANITRVSYHKAIDMHMLFVEADGTPEQLAQVERELRAQGYLPEKPSVGSVMMMEFKLHDQPGAVLPVLELIDRCHFNISYISSQESGEPYQLFKMGLLVEDSEAVSCFMREVSSLCPVRVIHYDSTEKNLDNTVFYISFANEVAQKAALSDEDRQGLMLNANLVMQLLDERDHPPYKTFEYIGRFAEGIHNWRRSAFEARISEYTGARGAKLRIAEPPAGCNLAVIEKDGEPLWIDSGFACYHDELLCCMRTLVKHFDRREKFAIITHADVDHCGLLDLYDHVYLNEKCACNFAWERAKQPNAREQNPLHAPYVRISKLLSGYRPPERCELHVLGGTLEPLKEPLVPIGVLDFHGLHL
ncbi:MAG: Zn-dependent hydrolase, partial [Clostridia bacterium]